MNGNTANDENAKQVSKKLEINWLEFSKKIWNYRRLILQICNIGIIIGILIVLGTPKEYTAKTLIVPEKKRRSFLESSAMDATTTDFNSFTTDAIYPPLYPAVIHSTPFLVRLFNIKVRGQNDNAPIPLAQYLKERQKSPWWNTIMSLPFKLIGQTMSLFRDIEDIDNKRALKKGKINIFQLTREQAGIASIIASRIDIKLDEKKRAITLFVTMQDPLVAATVADTVRIHLQEYITEYRTIKAKKVLEYKEKLREDAKMKYCKAQEKYTQYADANQGLTRLTSRTELTHLRNEMDLSLVIYNQTERQVQAARARVKKETPAYAVIQPVQVPLSPSKPQKMKILVVCFFLSIAGSVGWILIGKDFVKNLRSGSRNSSQQIESNTDE